MDTLKTRCPECQAQFSISEEQLNAANGKVRCGSCLAVFDASEALIGHKEDNSSSITPLSAEDFAQLDSSSANNPTPSYTQEPSQGYDKHMSQHQHQHQEDKWAQELLDDGEIYQRQTSPKVKHSHDEEAANTAKNADESLSATKDDALDFDVFEQLSSTEKQGLLSAINSQPIELTIDKQRFVRTKATLAWLMIVISLLALPIQYIAFNFDQLALHQKLRPGFSLLCEHLHCKLPELHNSQMIKTSNLIVRSHPEKKGALVVDALLLNRADYQQAYPDLELIFTNLQQRIVAARRFTPAEYLDGEQKHQTHMPIKQAVHISLHLFDPGAEAINYRLQLQAAKL